MEQIEKTTCKSSNAQWCVVFTAPHAERCVHQELEARGIECIMPLYAQTVRWRGRIIHREVPRFSRCIFVRICQADILVLSRVSDLIIPRDIMDCRYPECFSDFIPK